METQNNQAQEQTKQKAQPKKPPVDQGEYDRYCELKFQEIDGAKLKDEAKKEMLRLEEKIKSCEGLKPIRTVTAAIKMDKIRLVKDIPVPAEIIKIIGDDEKAKKYYFS